MSIFWRFPFVVLVVLSTLWWQSEVKYFDRLLSPSNLISVVCIILLGLMMFFLAFARKAPDHIKVIAGMIALFSFGFLVFTISNWSFILCGMLLLSTLALGVFSETNPTHQWSKFRRTVPSRKIYVVTNLVNQPSMSSRR